MASHGVLQGLCATELIEEDTRPTFVLDLGTDLSHQPARLDPVYCNAAMRLSPDLLGLVHENRQPAGASKEDDSDLNFLRWALNPQPSEAAVLFNSFIWTFQTLKDRWKVITGVPLEVLSAAVPAHPVTTRADMDLLPDKDPSNGVIKRDANPLDGAESQPPLRHATWTDLLPQTPHIELFRNTDWSATPLGPLESWSSRLQHTTSLLLCDSWPGCLFWGPQKVIIYNEAYVPIAGKAKPLGSTFRNVWEHDIVEGVNHAFETSALIGYASTMEDSEIFLDRHGYCEETYLSWNMIPIHGCHREIEGFWNTVFETTRERLAERRIRTLILLTTPANMTSFWDETLKGFESNERDCPFVMVYSLAKSDRQSDQDPSPCSDDFHFEAALGLYEETATSFEKDGTENIGKRFLPLLIEAQSRLGSVSIFSVKDESLPKGIFHGLRWRGFEEEPHSVAVIPLKAGYIEYYLLLGLNPRKAYDSDYDQFVELLNRQLATSITSANLMDQARINQAKLSRQVVDGEARFKVMTVTNPAGMFYFSPLGEVLYANDTWYNMTGHKRDHRAEMSFMDAVFEADVPLVIEEWHKIAVLRQKRTFEIRLKKKTSKGRNTWILASGMPEESEDGSLKSIMGSITDISHQKEAQDDAIERARLSEQLTALTDRHRVEAEEARKSQERFMDITSHEMRNPLSAILQSADGIVSSMLELESSNSKNLPSDILQSTLEAAQTVMLCAQHQARIINDVLTLSKLDSAMVQIAPVAVQPDAVVQATLSMFSRELASLDIGLDFQLANTYKERKIDWVLLDPSRLTQVFINLMTNAIKFTKPQPVRRICVAIGASTEKPPYVEGITIKWFPSRAQELNKELNKDLTMDPEWGSSEQVYIYFSVRDTGRGLTNEEQSRLFHRFAQANVRTHVEYGGSGLGLFISRELTELQGGEIGLNSEPGKGSTFAFYIKGRRASAPAKNPGLQSEGNAKKLNARTAKEADPVNGLASVPIAKRSIGSSQHCDILLVEDNVVNQRVLGKQLQKAGYSVALANHGQEALEHLRSTNFWEGNVHAKNLDVILMDLEMPIMDGLTAARHIRELEANGVVVRHVPIIAVTANARKEQIETCLTAGMDDVMPKPFRVAELTDKMEKLLSIG